MSVIIFKFLIVLLSLDCTIGVNQFLMKFCIFSRYK
uniref:Uncharacterized protein n=1 Tax=Rhizophora mucronata TaxID=61149 RepID=A0A2P2NHV7_RHIMU